MLECPGLSEVVVGLAERHGLDDGAARRVVPLHQQHPLGQRVHLVGPGEEINAGHPGHVVVDDEQRHRFVPIGQPAQRRQPCGGPRLTDDTEVPAELAAQIIPERAHHPGVVVDHEQYGR